jgi:proton-coupled amino acid transporter
MSWIGMALDGAIVVLGVVIGVTGTWSSLMEILALKA